MHRGVDAVGDDQFDRIRRMPPSLDAHRLVRRADRHGVAALLVPERGPVHAIGAFRSLCWTTPEEAT